MVIQVDTNSRQVALQDSQKSLQMITLGRWRWESAIQSQSKNGLELQELRDTEDPPWGHQKQYGPPSAIIRAPASRA